MSSAVQSDVVVMPPLLLRARDVAAAYGVSESLVGIFVRKGWLTPVRIPGIRATRFAREQVEELARKIKNGEIAE